MYCQCIIFFQKNHVENVLALFPDKVCTDLDIIDLTNSVEEELDGEFQNFTFREVQKYENSILGWVSWK